MFATCPACKGQKGWLFYSNPHEPESCVGEWEDCGRCHGIGRVPVEIEFIDISAVTNPLLDEDGKPVFPILNTEEEDA